MRPCDLRSDPPGVRCVYIQMSASRPLHLDLGVTHRCNDVWIVRTPTQISAHELSDAHVRSRLAVADACDSRHDLAGRAIPALECIMIDKGLLHGMKRGAGRSKTLDRRDALACRHHGQLETREYRFATDMQGTRTALPVITTLLGPREADVLAERVEQRRPGVDCHTIGRIIDLQRQLCGARAPRFQCLDRTVLRARP